MHFGAVVLLLYAGLNVTHNELNTSFTIAVKAKICKPHLPPPVHCVCFFSPSSHQLQSTQQLLGASLFLSAPHKTTQSLSSGFSMCQFVIIQEDVCAKQQKN